MDVDDQNNDQAAIVEQNRERIETFRANRHNTRTATRNCKLETALNEQYQGLVGPLRTLSEDYTVVRRDAFDLVNMDILRWVEEDGNDSTCPPILSQAYWEKAFMLCTLPPTHIEPTAEPNFLHLTQTFNWCLQQCRLRQPNEFPDGIDPNVPQPLYDPPDFNSGTLRRRLAAEFARGEAIPAVKNHLGLNPPKYMKHTFTAFFYELQDRIGRNLPRRPQAFANVMTKHLLNHDPPEDVDFHLVDFDEQPLAVVAEVKAYYQTHYEEFEGSFANYDLTEVGKKPGRRVNMAYIPGALRYLAGLLSMEAEILDSQRWTVIPIGKLQMAFVPVDTHVLYWVCRLAHENPDIDFNAPPALMREPPGRRGEIFIPLSSIYGNVNPLLKEEFFEQLFNLDPISKRRMRYSAGYVFNPNVEPITFKFSFNTDGVRACFHFVRALTTRQGERMPDTSADVRYYPRELDLTNWHRGMYHLNKEPGGLGGQRLQATRIIGIDPGIREVITGTDTTVNLADPQTRQQHVVSISNKEYQNRSLSNWIKQKTLSSRQKGRMEQEYLNLKAFPHRTTNLQAFFDHVHLRCHLHNILHPFACQYRHREQRATTFAARVSAQESIVNQILGLENVADLRNDFFAHRHGGKRQRKLARRAARAQRREQDQDVVMEEAGGPEEEFEELEEEAAEPQVQTIVAYGAARFGATSKRHQAVPVETLRARIARRALLVLVDEFRTSVTCHECHGRLQQFREPETLICQHKKKYIRDSWPVGDDDDFSIVHGKPRQWCLDDDGQRLHWTSTCNDRVQVDDFRNNVYALKWCPTCQTVFDRDIGASSNIHFIFELYMLSDGELDSRPPAMQRGQVQDVVDEVEAEDEMETDEDDEL
ncbi:hypothetical protein O0I10_008160 [Lichtheimia ornata]|uniref:Uncharacterized protein n=1 Tax=Lichtheimia ornata TaxID=688661 RepID=A0AAD7V0Z3_9FUNG|nr:uncharacterized protein O0I10_008160 [Lichtheimia ornata]KAJ8656147.1 hypothetical protein O0I10_008160 [Lichtheimia ornata]